jgi:peroxiredoxin
MLLKSGMMAPSFESLDVTGEIFSLRENQGKKIHLSFFRNATCPLCNLRYFKLRGLYETKRSSSNQMISVFESSSEVLTKNLIGQKIPYPLLPDPSQKLYTLYGLENSWRAAMTSLLIPRIYREAAMARQMGLIKSGITDPDRNLRRLPAEFLINPDGTLAQVFYSRYVGNHMPLSDIENFLD